MLKNRWKRNKVEEETKGGERRRYENREQETERAREKAAVRKRIRESRKDEDDKVWMQTFAQVLVV